jgi:hypothetical protein
VHRRLKYAVKETFFTHPLNVTGEWSMQTNN